MRISHTTTPNDHESADNERFERRVSDRETDLAARPWDKALVRTALQGEDSLVGIDGLGRHPLERPLSRGRRVDALLAQPRQPKVCREGVEQIDVGRGGRGRGE